MISLNFDIGEIKELLDIDKQVKKALDKAVKELANEAYKHMRQEADSKLHSRRELFLENLSFDEEDDGVFIITLGAKARWIDDGMPEHNMLDDLLASPKAKTAKDGSRYLVVPFDHSPGQGPTKTTQANQDLISTIKSELKTRKIPFAKLELDEHGQPKTGKLHSFDINQKPLKTADAPGQGKGPVGAVRQGPTGVPLLSGVNIHQTPVKGKDGVDRIKRSITTFRIASSKHKEQGGRWDHPGSEPMNFFSETIDWATREWESKIKPELLAKIISEI